MALIYKIKFPDNIFTTARGPEAFASSSLTSYLSNFYKFLPGGGVQQKEFDTSNQRPYTTPTREIIIPKTDITTKDFKVSTKLEENKSKITYDFGLVGESAKIIVDYLKYIRLPLGNSRYPKAQQGLEYLFSLDKQIKITIEDTCCPEFGKRTKTILQGFIPLNSIRYCDDEECSVNCTIYEDSKRTDAISCIESSVLGVRSKVGILVNAENANDKIMQTQFSTNTVTKFATVPGKWFDSCVQPQSTTMPYIVTNLIGVFKVVILSLILPFFAILSTIVVVINLIIRAVNLIPRVDIDLISFQPIDFATDVFDNIFGIERVIEGLYGCKYIRGGYRVASILKTVCSVCNFSSSVKTSTGKLRDWTVNQNAIYDDFSVVKTPISYNPFVPNGDVSTPINPLLRDPFNSVYIPAEEAYSRRNEKPIRRTLESFNITPQLYTKTLRDVAIRGASIETTDKVLSRIATLWNTGWDVVTTPVTEITPEGIQLQVGPIEGRYIFDKSELVTIEGATVCYDVGKGSPIGYETVWSQDSADSVANSQYQSYRGYVTYFNETLVDRKPKNVKTFTTDFAPTQYIGSLKDDTVYDDFIADRVNVIGYGQINEYFEDGQMINSSEFISVPKLVTFKIGSTRVLDDGDACRVKEHNKSWLGAIRLSDYVDSLLLEGQASTILYTANSQYPLPVGVQNFTPYYSIGYYGENKTLPGSSYSEFEIGELFEDYLLKYSSSENGPDNAADNLRNGKPSFLGPFINNQDGRYIPHDSFTYNFAPLMEFTFEKENYNCNDETLISQCITNAVVNKSNPFLYENNNPAFKLRLLKLSQGLGVITSLEIDYENRNIKAEGYVIPFIQAGKDYSTV